MPSPPDQRRQDQAEHKNPRKHKWEESVEKVLQHPSGGSPKCVTDKLIPDINQDDLNDLVLQLEIFDLPDSKVFNRSDSNKRSKQTED